MPRTPGFCSGAERGHFPRPGHIAGALSVPFDSVVDMVDHLLPDADLAAILQSAGVEPGSDVVTILPHRPAGERRSTSSRARSATGCTSTTARSRMVGADRSAGRDGQALRPRLRGRDGARSL